jgi:hypothetical protein
VLLSFWSAARLPRPLMAPDESPATRCFSPMKENIITDRITSTPERSADTASLRPPFSLLLFAFLYPRHCRLPDNNRPVPGKTMVGATHDRPRHIRDCRANKNVEAERGELSKIVRNKARAGS